MLNYNIKAISTEQYFMFSFQKALHNSKVAIVTDTLFS